MNQSQLDGTENVEVVAICKTEARELTDKIRDRSEELWHMLLEAYERGVHTTLGYTSWGAYFEQEFGGSYRRGYQLLDAGRVVRAVEGASAEFCTEAKPNAGQADELAPLVKKDPDAAVEAWHEAVEEHGQNVIAADVREVVKRKTEDTSAVWSQEERELAERMLEGEPVVVNMRSGVHPRLIKWAKENGNFVRVDRKTDWGNPFTLEDGDRDTIIRYYGEIYFPYKPSLHKRRSDLQGGKALGCWCAGDPCHADFLKAWADGENA